MARRSNAIKGEGYLTRQITPKAIKEFLDIVSQGWTETKAARDTGIDLKRWQKYKKKHRSFVLKVERAHEAGEAVLEDAAHRRAVKGTLKPIVNQGRIVTFVREYSDSLLAGALKVRSKKYAINSAAGATFEDSFAGSAERLLTRLTDLFSQLEADAIEPIKTPVR